MEMPRINWFYVGSVLLNIILLMFLLRCCSLLNAPCENIREVVRIDTVRVPENKVVPVVAHSNPKPKRVSFPRKAGVVNLPVSADDSVDVRVSGSGRSSASTVFNCTTDTAYYADTIRKPDSFVAVVNDTLYDNRLQGRSIVFKNLSPTVVTTIERTVQAKERIRLYVGAFAGVQIDYRTRAVSNWTIGPELMLTIPQGAALHYGFDAKNNGHNIGLLYKIKLKR
jgi:hypothetical protein